MIALIPETAPFSAEQRAWLNGFFAGLMGLDGQAAAGAAAPAPAPAEEEEFPWHDPTLELDARLKLAQGRPFPRVLMAAMGQLDCGQCGYLCKEYAQAIAGGAEKDLSKCVPGGKPTQKKLKELLASAPPPPPAAAPAVKFGDSKPAPEVNSGSSRDAPYMASLVRSEPLNGNGAQKQIQNVVLSLGDSGIVYKPGDSLGVWPRNYPEEVELILTILRCKGSEQVALSDGRTVAARQALTREANLRQPTQELYRLLSRHAKDRTEQVLLARLADDDGPAAKLGIHDVLDTLVAFRSARPPITDFVAALSRLQPRLYSIASSLKRHPGEVHLTVAVVRYELNRRGYEGVASTFFAERLSPGHKVPVYLQPSHGFRLPADPAVPVIMVGPGTGIAPFRAFLEERAAAGAAGKNWLFFGNPRRATDFLYQEELDRHLVSGVLTRLDTAFSRDQEHKVYVQHRMLENAAELWRWLQDGAHFYVCGDAKRMAADVDRALTRVAAERGGMDDAAAKAWVVKLAKDGRYLRDVY